MPDKNQTIDKLISFRKALHQQPELSGAEEKTSLLLQQATKAAGAELLCNLGGHSFAAIFDSGKEGPCLVLRADMDAVAVKEVNTFDYASNSQGIMHACGHDGHSSILIGLAQQLQTADIRKGKLVLLFQAAEETGKGAEAILKDERFLALKPDFIFGFHNLPDHPQGELVFKDGVFACASKGLHIIMKGKTSHAAYPGQGRSPAHALAYMINEIDLLPETFEHFTQITLTHARIGEATFGVSPGLLEMMATMRAHEDDDMQELSFITQQSLKEIARAEKLSFESNWHEPFPNTKNHQPENNVLRQLAKQLQLPHKDLQHPLRWSEDFGHYLKQIPGAFFGIGCGEKHPALHNDTYDFPDEIMPVAIKFYQQLIKHYLTN